MIKVENMDVFGWEAAVRGMRNPMNSWGKSTSGWNECTSDCADWEKCGEGYECPICSDKENVFFMLCKNDLELMKLLSKAGNDHGKFLRFIDVTCDITAPLYWWKEFDTYKVGTVANSCSTMHKIHEKEFTLDDFSHEHLTEEDDWNCSVAGLDILLCDIENLNEFRRAFIETKDKKYWWQMIQLLPSSYNQRRTVQLNYQVLKSMYHARKNHKLNEWRELCEWMESLPYFKEICVEV